MLGIFRRCIGGGCRGKHTHTRLFFRNVWVRMCMLRVRVSVVDTLVSTCLCQKCVCTREYVACICFACVCINVGCLVSICIRSKCVYACACCAYVCINVGCLFVRDVCQVFACACACCACVCINVAHTRHIHAHMCIYTCLFIYVYLHTHVTHVYTYLFGTYVFTSYIYRRACIHVQGSFLNSYKENTCMASTLHFLEQGFASKNTALHTCFLSRLFHRRF